MKSGQFSTSILLILLALCSSCGEDNSPAETVIGSQTWSTKNLNVDKFQNGELIPESTTMEEWLKASESKQPTWCYHDFDSGNESQHGKLYNWYAVNDPRGLAPVGWHIPSLEEWTVLLNFCSDNGLRPAKKLKSKEDWKRDSNGTDDFGFSAYPSQGLIASPTVGGSFSSKCGESCVKMGFDANWWCSSKPENSDYCAHFIQFTAWDYQAETDHCQSFWCGSSVRCIKD
jgi:uncharacterized protein (TIGR02145 family)